MTSEALDYQPFTVGARLRIAPPQALPSTDGRLDLWMPRGAFGSGEHETTASCLEVLETLPLLGVRVLDLGSGTGILAIAALKLGASSALCLDIDPAAVEAARLSCTLNDVVERVDHRCGSLSAWPDADLFEVGLANLHGDLLLALGGDLWRRIRPGGLLLLSGILWEHAFDVRTLFVQAGAELQRERWLEEYVTLLLRRPTAA